MLVRFVFYGFLGWCAEVVFTALTESLPRRDWRLPGTTYLWMFPIYGFGGLLFEPCHEALRGWPWLARGLVWTLAIFAVEYATGRLLRRLTGRCPWDYSYSRFHLHCFIRFDYAPVWFGFGLLLERVHDAVGRL